MNSVLRASGYSRFTHHPPFSTLGSTSPIPYSDGVIGVLRFIALMNAAVWLGTTVFFTFGAAPACFSADMKSALRVSAGDSYFSGVIADVIMTRYYQISLACAVVALLHSVSRWLYMGRPSRKFSSALLVCLFGITLLGSNQIRPALRRLNHQRFTATQPADRQAAARSFRILSVVEEALNFLVIGGLVVYTWRIANPSETLRFVTPVKYPS